ncbi:DUF3108 domain-containing protein [Xylophilus sp. Kf1]|nr:DUF3108 domain-containing protein [Xylophilus sp. Kf1]
MPKGRIALLVAAVLVSHLLVLGWLPMGSPGGHAMDEKAVHLVTRVVPVAPPPPPPPPAPKPRPAPRPVAPAAPAVPATATAQAPVDAEPVATDMAAADAAAAGAPAAMPSPSPAPAESAPPAVAPPPPPIGLPAPVVLRYAMTGNAKGLTYHANAELLWQQDGARYTARMEVSAFLIGSRVQTSEGAIGPGGLEPERFSDKARREQATHFDRVNQRIVFSSNAPEVPLPPGAQDRLGVFLQLASQLAGDPARYPPGSTIAIPTAGPRDLGEWTFVVDAPETLNLPIGTQATVKLDRAPRKEFDTRVEVWFAPALGYLPVRIRITQQSGDFIDQTLKSAERP